jgi:hypothetical protein
LYAAKTNQPIQEEEMNFFFFKNKITIYSAFIFYFILNLNNTLCQSNSVKGWTNVKYAIYFTSGDVERLLADSIQFNKTMEYFVPVKAYKVYLEGNSHGGKINVPLLKRVRDRFKAMGIQVWGSMVPVSSKGGPSTYNDQEDLNALKTRMQSLAMIFNHIILDDWLFTTATDPKSAEDRGAQSWEDYRTKLILEQSKKYIIDPAKEVNPDCKVIIKYPNWYEGHRQNGYDVYNETKQFDMMDVGIETRVPETQDQHIPIYSGYVFQKWFSSVEPSKWVGAWLDNYGMNDAADDYVAQVWQAILAKAPEIILWCAGQLYPATGPSSNVYPHFREMLPEFDKVAGLLRGDSKGIPMYLPYGSTGVYNIFGYLGMAGIPIDPVAQFPSTSQNAIFTMHSLFRNTPDQLANQMLARLQEGNDIFMTWGLWKKLKDTELKNTLSFVDYGGTVSSSEFRLRHGWNQQIIKTVRPFTFPRIETTTWPYVRNAALVLEDYDYGIMLETPYLKGNIYVLAMPENSYDLLRLPSEVLERIRQSFYKELGFILQGPGKVAIYLFGQNQYVLYNMNNEAAPVTLKFNKVFHTEDWKELVYGEQISVKQDSTYSRFGGSVLTNVSLTLQPFEITIVQAP